MRTRKQSIVTLSFGEERASAPSVHHRPEPSAGSEERSAADDLPALCREIAGALLRRYLLTGDGAGARREIVAGLVEHLECERGRAEDLVDLALETIHAKSYGRYRRNLLELGMLVARAGGELRDPGAN